ncbi:hypothetical protein BaRGS_00004501 [Batillaria attramentaria]|uniref:Uncharacterized protein n=1 Tax=Batillaria attramentaria TaxID=370345 RepID=A0ABD0LXH4_9CAEN
MCSRQDFKLPNIFQAHRSTATSSSPLATPHTSRQPSGDLQSISKTKAENRCPRAAASDEQSELLSHRSIQQAALLLPLRASDANVPTKKPKKNPTKRSQPCKSDNNEHSDRPMFSTEREAERTDLSDTKLIERVQEETAVANTSCLDVTVKTYKTRLKESQSSGTDKVAQLRV